jgi:hypothetical protein
MQQELYARIRSAKTRGLEIKMKSTHAPNSERGCFKSVRKIPALKYSARDAKRFSGEVF